MKHLIVVFGLLLSIQLVGQKISLGGNWSNTNNWNPIGSVPSSSDSVVIPGGVNCVFDLGTSTIKSINILPGGTLTLQSSGTLTILSGDFISNGVINPSGNTNVTFSSCVADQKMILSSPTSLSIITVSKCASKLMVIGADLKINNSFNLNTGVCQIEKNLTIGSGATVTGTGFSNTKMIEFNGNPSDMSTGVFIKEENASVAAMQTTFPIGAAGQYTPVIISTIAGTGITPPVKLSLKPIYNAACPGGLVKRSLGINLSNLSIVSQFGFTYQFPSSEVCLNSAGTVYRDAIATSGTSSLGANPANFTVSSTTTVNGIWKLAQNLTPVITEVRSVLTNNVITSACPNDSIYLIGSNLTGLNLATFGGINASTFSVLNDSKAKVYVPAGAVSGNLTCNTSSGVSNNYPFTINTIPLTPASVTGTVSVCQGTTGLGYTTTTPGATSYNWTFPAGFTITSGAGTSNVVVTAGSISGILSVTAQNACGISTAKTVAITIIPNNTVSAASSSPSVCTGSSMPTITHITTGATGIGAATGMPTGVTPSFAGSTISISGTPTSVGVFNYSIPLTGGCGVVFATGTITVNGPNVATAPNLTPTICINTTLPAVSHTTAGATGIGTATGLPTGVTASWASNTISLSGIPTTSGVFNYTIPLTGGCGVTNATGTITVNPDNSVSAISPFTTCQNSAMSLLVHNTSGATGIGVATNLPPGVNAVFSSNSITISGTPTSGGTFNYSIPLTGGCGTINATGTITVTPSTVAGSLTPTVSSVCSGSNTGNITVSGFTGSIIDWEYSLDNFATAGISTGITTPTYTFTNLSSTTYYKAIIQSGGCAVIPTASAAVNVSSPTLGGTASASPSVVCAGSNSVFIEVVGYTGNVLSWESSTDNFSSVINTIASPTSGITETNLMNSTYYRAKIQSGVCPIAYSTVTFVTVDPLSVGGITSSPALFCSPINSGSVILTGHTGVVTGWESSLDGVSFSPITNVTAVQAYSNLSSTTHYRAVVKSGVCPTAVSTITVITINPSTTVGAGVDQPVCTNLPIVNLSANATNFTSLQWTTLGSGTFSSTNVLNPTYTLSAADKVSGTVKLVLTAQNGACPFIRDTVQLNVVAAPLVNATSPITVCNNSPNAGLTSTFSGAPAVSWSSITGSGVFSNQNAANSNYTLDAAEIGSGLAKVVLTTVGGSCPPVKDTVVINVTLAPTVSVTSPQTACSGMATSINLTASSGTISWTSSLLSGSTSGFSPGSGSIIAQVLTGVGSVQYLVSSFDGFCTSDVKTLVVNVSSGVNLTLGLTSIEDTVCFGKTANVGVLNSENGVTYKAFVGSFISGPVSGNGGTLLINIPFANLTAGALNTVQVEASSVACGTSAFLATTKKIHASNNSVNTITTSGAADLCSGSIQLDVTLDPNYIYQWQNSGSIIVGENTNTLAVLVPGDYKAFVTDKLKCTSITSPVAISRGGLVPSVSISSSISGGKKLTCTNYGTGVIQWYAVTTNGDKKIMSQNLDQYNAYYDGSYYVIVDYGNCRIASSKISINGVGDNLNRVALTLQDDFVYLPVPFLDNKLLVAPNPSTDQTTLYFPEGESNVELMLISAQGKVMREYEADGSSPFSLSLANIPAGVYMIKVKGENGTYFNSIIVE